MRHDIPETEQITNTPLSSGLYKHCWEKYSDLTSQTPLKRIRTAKPPENDRAYLRCLEETKTYRTA